MSHNCHDEGCNPPCFTLTEEYREAIRAADEEPIVEPGLGSDELRAYLEKLST